MLSHVTEILSLYRDSPTKTIVSLLCSAQEFINQPSTKLLTLRGLAFRNLEYAHQKYLKMVPGLEDMIEWLVDEIVFSSKEDDGESALFLSPTSLVAYLHVMQLERELEHVFLPMGVEVLDMRIEFLLAGKLFWRAGLVVVYSIYACSCKRTNLMICIPSCHVRRF